MLLSLLRPAESVKLGLDAKKQVRKDSHLRAKKKEESWWTAVGVTKHAWETPPHAHDEELTLLSRRAGESLLETFLTLVPASLL